jgi:hypothetical protein
MRITQMLSFLILLRRFLRAIRLGWQDPEFRGMLYLVLFLLVVGTLFYRSFEGWSVADSLYFSVITLTTIGYGDLAPSTLVSKMFTIMYIIIGLGILAAFITRVAENALAKDSSDNPPQAEQ